ncbi:MAG: hypothetical protein E6Q91_04790, partial [Actinobacteria bacterium]
QDHGDRERPGAGYPYTESYMADNDLALGRVVEFLSRTPQWKEMAIIVIEDDPQGGVDHVDAHRSLCLVISPWVKRGYIGHKHYSFGSIFKTMWNVFGLPPQNQYDAGALDFGDLFTEKPDFAPFNAVDALELGPASQRAQVGTQVCLDGKALDGADGLGGIPVELGIRGTESITDRVFTEMSGDFSYCYTRTEVGTDTVSALFRSVQSSEVTIEWFAPPAPSTTPEPTPSASPAKLPITVTKVAPKRVALKANGSRVLVKRTTTNASGALTYTTRCKHTKRQPGGKHMCKVTVSSKGKVRVVSAGYGKLTVRVTATATPKPGQEQAWLPSTWRKTWTVKG